MLGINLILQLIHIYDHDKFSKFVPIQYILVIVGCILAFMVSVIYAGFTIDLYGIVNHGSFYYIWSGKGFMWPGTDFFINGSRLQHSYYEFLISWIINAF